MLPDLILMVKELPPLKNRIKEFRKKAKLNQRAVGEAMGVAHTTIGRWENSLQPITTDELLALARVLDCHPVELILDVRDVAISEQEHALLLALRKLDDKQRDAWIKLLTSRQE